jgi:hypothetical protein
MVFSTWTHRNWQLERAIWMPSKHSSFTYLFRSYEEFTSNSANSPVNVWTISMREAWRYSFVLNNFHTFLMRFQAVYTNYDILCLQNFGADEIIATWYANHHSFERSFKRYNTIYCRVHLDRVPTICVANSPLNCDGQTFSYFSGDVVICRSPSDPSTFICKRVKGLEGDLVSSASTSSWPGRVVCISEVCCSCSTLC